MIIRDVDRYRVMDPLFEGVRVVMSSRGESYSPSYIQGVSGAAFRIAGPCPCAPTCSAAMGTEDLARLLGYEIERLSLCEEGMDPAKDVDKLVTRVKSEIRAGRPAIVWHAFTTAEWDVVCGFDEPKHQFLGRGSYAGQQDYATAAETRTATCLDICPALGAILVGRKTGQLDARDAELAALEEALRHAHAPRDRFVIEAGNRELPWRFRQGLACFEGWAHNFRANPDRVPGSGDRYCLGVYSSTHRAAAGFMRELAPKYPMATAHFERAAEHFAAEANALDICRNELCRGWEGWQKPDPALAARMATQLSVARDAYAKAIDEIDQALGKLAPQRAAAAHRPASLRRDGAKVWVRNVPTLAWGRGKDCMFIGSLEAAMSVTEHPYTYADLMGLSGLAFRVRWCNDGTKTKWCPSCAVGEMPDEYAAIQKLTGWQVLADWGDTAGRDVGKLREKIVASIDAGRPVATYPDHPNMALVYGYEDGGKTLLLTDYMKKEQPSRLAVEKLSEGQTYLGDYVEPPSLRDTLREALQAAVRNWKRERHDGGLADREYWYGDAALAAWVKDLGAYDTLPDETKKRLMDLDDWCLTALLDARKAAVSFLRDWATALDPEPRDALKRAADQYQQEVKALEALVAAQRAVEKGAAWSKPARQRRIDALTEARRLDAAAIAEIEKALH